MSDEKVDKVLAMFDEEDIPFIKASVYKEHNQEQEKTGDENGDRQRKMGSIPISRN